MADPRKAAPPAVDGGDQLAELNDHLGRFLQHADQLLDEWARFGAQVRASVDAEVGRLDEATAGAVDRAADRAGRALEARLDDKVAERVDRTLGEGVTRLRGELDRMARAARGLADAEGGQRRGDLSRVTLFAAIGANVLLVALLVLAARDCGAAASVAPAASVTAAPDAGVTALQQACATLIGGWSDDAAAIVLRAGTAACGPGAEMVAERFAERMAPPAGIDAGVPPVDAGPADAGTARPKKKK